MSALLLLDFHPLLSNDLDPPLQSGVLLTALEGWVRRRSLWTQRGGAKRF